MLVEDLKHAVISISSSGDNTIIAAPTNGFLAIDQVNLIPDSAVSMKLISGTTDRTGVYSLTANQGYTMDNVMCHQKGIITCGVGEAFIINLGGAVQCSGFVRYRIIGG